MAEKPEDIKDPLKQAESGEISKQEQIDSTSGEKEVAIIQPKYIWKQTKYDGL